MAWDAGAVKGATVRATVNVVVTMFMEMSFERECAPSRRALCAPARPHSSRPRSPSSDVDEEKPKESLEKFAT